MRPEETSRRPSVFGKAFADSIPVMAGYGTMGFAAGVLLAVNGLPQLLAALMLIKRHPLAYWVALACGVILMLWIGLEWWIWGFATISNIYFILGLLEAAAAIYCLRSR